MKKMIKLSDTHYIIVDDSEIKEGDWFYNQSTNYIGKTLKKEGKFWICNNIEGFHLLSEAEKITHSTQPLEDYTRADGKIIKVYVQIKPLPLSEVEEALYGYSAEMLAKEQYSSDPNDYEDEWYAGFIIGFRKRQELVKDKIFNEIDKQISDFKHVLKESNSTIIKQTCEGAIFGLNRLKQSLLPKKEWEVEFDESGKLKIIK